MFRSLQHRPVALAAGGRDGAGYADGATCTESIANDQGDGESRESAGDSGGCDDLADGHDGEASLWTGLIQEASQDLTVLSRFDRFDRHVNKRRIA